MCMIQQVVAFVYVNRDKQHPKDKFMPEVSYNS